MNPNVDFYFEKEKKWQKELQHLRKIVLGCELAEELKWGCPCYSFQQKNIVLIHVFKDYCALLFFKGALLNDSGGILIQQTKNVQSARQIRFTSVTEIVKMKQTVQTYIYEAIEVERAGLKVKLKKTSAFKMADELKVKLDKSPAFKTAFYALTPGRQRGYILYFSAAKQAKTRESRIEKYQKQILAGKGLGDE